MSGINRYPENTSVLHEIISTNSALASFGAILYLSYVIFLITALIVNGKRLHSDLFTDERKSLDHRRRKPTITGTYSLILLLTQISIFFWFCSAMFMLSTYYFARSAQACTTLEVLAGISGELAYITLYMIFLARLHWLYHDSKFAHNVSKLLSVGILIIVYGIIVIYTIIAIWSSQLYSFGSPTVFPNYCTGTLEPYTGALAFIQDTLISYAFLYAFYKPLKKTVVLVNNGDGDHNMDSLVISKIRYSGTKTLILTVISTLSTSIFVLGAVVTGLNWVIGLDAIFHTICITLMTPHYHDKLWYQRICCLCLKCPCIDQSYLDYDDTKELNKSINNNNNNDKDQALLSIDTLSQLRVTGKNLVRNYNQIEMKDNSDAVIPVDNNNNDAGNDDDADVNVNVNNDNDNDGSTD